MRPLLRALRSFGRFWYDFVVGDDPKIAAGVVLALGVALAALAVGAGDAAVALIGGLAVMAAFAVGLAVDVRPRRPAAGRARKRFTRGR